jgi:hypothetical protein
VENAAQWAVIVITNRVIATIPEKPSEHLRIKCPRRRDIIRHQIGPNKFPRQPRTIRRREFWQFWFRGHRRQICGR